MYLLKPPQVTVRSGSRSILQPSYRELFINEIFWPAWIRIQGALLNPGSNSDSDPDLKYRFFHTVFPIDLEVISGVMLST